LRWGTSSAAISSPAISTEGPVDVADRARFDVNVIPYTLAHTTWEDRVPGDLLNLEVDLLARYVARLAETEGRVP
jgi:riboflavin synthase